MDNFAEQLVKRDKTGAIKTQRAMILSGGIILTVALLFLSIFLLGRMGLMFVGVLLAAAAGLGTYFLWQNTFVEYEYTFTNGELDVDKIIAQKKRRELMSVNIRQFTDFGRYDDSMEEPKEMTVILATDNSASNEYYADFTDETVGSARLIFVPDERMLENIRKFLPAKLRAKQL